MNQMRRDGHADSDSLPWYLASMDRLAMLDDAGGASSHLDQSSQGPSWTSPDLSPLGSGRRAVPSFPVDLFGDFWGGWVGRRAEGASAPDDYVGVALLSAVGATLANVRWPLAGAEWCEPPVIWCAAVGSPSAGKSPALDPVMRLLAHAEERMAEGFDDTLRVYEADRLAARAMRDNWEADVRQAATAGDLIPPMPAKAEEPTRPERPRIRVGDVTAEKLGSLAAAMPRGLLVVRDELAGWLGSFDRYGGGGADRALALEMYGGRQFRIDRKKDPLGLLIPHLSIGALGGTQPDKLELIVDGVDDGFAARILWAWPDAHPQFRLKRGAVDDNDALLAFARLTELAMGADHDGRPEPKRLRLEAEAENLVEEFGQHICGVATENEGLLLGALGKARGHALRLSCIIEHLWWSARGGPEPDRISADAVAAATAMVDGYFLPMARRVCGDATIPCVERNGMSLARHLKRHGVKSFNARTMRREIGGRLRESKVMDAACDALVEACLIRPVPSRLGTTPGRRSKDFDVNPIIWEPTL